MSSGRVQIAIAPHRELLSWNSIGRWLSLALQLTLLMGVVTTAWLFIDVAYEGVFKPAALYVFAIGLRLSIQFFTRAYHSGIYAIRRIYRPLPAILGVEVVGIAVTLPLVPFLGAWALPIGALIGVPIVAGLLASGEEARAWLRYLDAREAVLRLDAETSLH